MLLVRLALGPDRTVPVRVFPEDVETLGNGRLVTRGVLHTTECVGGGSFDGDYLAVRPGVLTVAFPGRGCYGLQYAAGSDHLFWVWHEDVTEVRDGQLREGFVDPPEFPARG
jgi:hypothetical protein